VKRMMADATFALKYILMLVRIDELFVNQGL
jgi:hypothetical protein